VSEHADKFDLGHWTAHLPWSDFDGARMPRQAEAITSACRIQTWEVVTQFKF
jgi:hypothetical protein